MGLSPSGNHHRRRSSVLTATGGPSQSVSIDQRDENPRSVSDSATHRREEQKAAEDADVSDLSSIAESVEMDFIDSDDDLNDDEETGLTAKQRRQRRRRRRQQRRQLDARIADVKASRDFLSMGLADRNVMRRLLVNLGLILLWYFFSLAISIVGLPFSPLVNRTNVADLHPPYSTTNGCSPKMRSFSRSLCSLPACIC